MFDSWSVSHRIAMGFGVILSLLLIIAIISHIASRNLARIFADYRATAQQTLAVNQVAGHLDTAQASLLTFQLSPKPVHADAVRDSLNRMIYAKERLGEVFHADPAQAETLAALLAKAVGYRDLFDEIDWRQANIDLYRQELDAQTVEIRSRYNGLIFEATVRGQSGAGSDVTRSKHAFLDARYTIGSFLRHQDEAAYQTAEHQLNSARSTLDTLGLRATGAMKEKVRELVVKLDTQLVTFRWLHDAVASQDTLASEALQRVGPALHADFDKALAAVVAAQQELGRRGAARIDQTSGLVTALAAATILIGIALAWVIGRWISGSVRNVAATMTELANENLDIGISGTEHGHEFGAMARALEVFRRNAEKLKTALDSERQLNGLQRQFVSMVSHEFRTPLAIIDAHAQQLLRRRSRLTEDRLGDKLSKIRLSVVRLTELMESVLDAAHLEDGRIDFRPEPCSPGDMLTELCGSYNGIHGDHEIIVDDSGLPEQIIADRRLLRQVFSNLLSNACKYSAAGTRIFVTGSCSGGEEIAISVRDEGLGIPEDELEKLFNRFFRASTSTGIAGSGIGLHLVRNFVDLHGGRIEVASRVDQGSTFTVHLPRTPPEAGIVLKAA